MYKCIVDGRVYSEEQMRNLFRFKEYRGYTGTFEDWIEMEIKKGYLEVINDEQRTTNILEYMSSKKKILMN